MMKYYKTFELELYLFLCLDVKTLMHGFAPLHLPFHTFKKNTLRLMSSKLQMTLVEKYRCWNCCFHIKKSLSLKPHLPLAAGNRINYIYTDFLNDMNLCSFFIETYLYREFYTKCIMQNIK